MVVGVTGATGIVYAVRLLEMLRALAVQSHLVVTKAAEQTCAYETGLSARERRQLVLLTRETPLHAGHIKAMLAATESGAIIAPPVPAFYVKPASLDDVVTHTVSRVLDLFGLHHPAGKRWGEDVGRPVRDHRTAVSPIGGNHAVSHP